jgi:hypothetical protein
MAIKMNKISLLTLTTALTLMLGNKIALSQGTTQEFFNPTLTSRDGKTLNIAGCVKSDRFSNVCGEDARGVASREFCKAKGYSTWSRNQVVDMGWKNRKTQWAWRDSDQGSGYFISDVSSFTFAYISCIKRN